MLGRGTRLTLLVAVSYATVLATQTGLFGQTNGPAGVVRSEGGDLHNVEDLVVRLSGIMGPLGVLAWYCYHTVSKAFPQKDQLLAQEREAFARELRDERDAHRQAIAQLVSELTEERKAFTVSIKETNALILEMVRTCPAHPPHGAADPR